MIFKELELKGCYIVIPEQLKDERGFFARSFCSDDFHIHGLKTKIDQCNISYNAKRGTVRGMHYQKQPCAEEKLVRCTSGCVFDVVVDLREDSRTYLQHVAVELSSHNRYMLYVPAGLAHGFQSLENETEVFYHMFGTYQPEYAAGVRWNDPGLSITWPLPISVISERDLSYEDIEV